MTSSRLQVKVCGIVDTDTARVAVAAGADYLGLVFADSPRRVEESVAERLVSEISAAWVGVFVDPAVDRVSATARRLGLSGIQLHGSEAPADCARITEATGIPVWKAMRWTGDRKEAERYRGAVDVVLLDVGRGGTGKNLPWARIGRTFEPRHHRLFIAGGLDASNVDSAVAAIVPDGVDASSRLESAPGVKDPARVRAFVRAARATRSPAARG